MRNFNINIIRILIFFIIVIIIVRYKCQGQFLYVDSAYSHIKEQFDRYHEFSYIYKDDNAGGNIYIPSIWQDEIENISYKQEFDNDPFDRSCVRITYFFKVDGAYSAIKYVYPENNTGKYRGFDLSNTSEISFYTKGSGIAEFYVGGINREPFHNDKVQYRDGIDIRSSGLVELDNEWTCYKIDLTKNIFWVYLDSVQGLNNKFIQPMLADHYSYMDFYYGFPYELGNTCMKIYWYGGDSHWAGVLLVPPEGNLSGNKGYNLTGLESIRFKAKISEEGNVKFIFGKYDDSSGQLTKTYNLTTDWQWYEWLLPSDRDYSNVVLGFGFYFGGDINTPDSSFTYIDSVYYEGIELESDFSNVINGFTVSAAKDLNDDSVLIYIDDIKYDHDNTEDARFCQSYKCGNDTFEITLKNRSDTYDNALKLLADIALYKSTSDIQCLKDAKITGDAFIFAIENDRYFNDNRLRNSYMSGILEHWDGTVRMPGWWDEKDEQWHEDIACFSTSTGNVAWAGIALVSLNEITHEHKYLEAAISLANWCIDKTQTDIGFSGGFNGWGESDQDTVKWKGTEHNIGLYALFTRLFRIVPDSKYESAAQNAKNFVLSMWNHNKQHFWTGTYEDGVTINKSNIAMNIQALYIMAFNDIISEYSNAIYCVNSYCYLEDYVSTNYAEPLSGYDFNTDLDGIWFEGSSQAILANKMKGITKYFEPVLSSIEYIQKNHKNKKFYNCNNKGIVASDHNNLSTGFDWEYNNRLHIGATAWYIFARLGFNPYYADFSCSEGYYVFDTVRICAGDSILLNGKYRKTAGTYIDTIQIMTPCDSLVITYLVINPLPYINLGKDTVIRKNSSIILDAGYGFEDYLWNTEDTTSIIEVFGTELH